MEEAARPVATPTRATRSEAAPTPARDSIRRLAKLHSPLQVQPKQTDHLQDIRLHDKAEREAAVPPSKLKKKTRQEPGNRCFAVCASDACGNPHNFPRIFFWHGFCQALLVEAAKARLRRMCAKHKTKRSLDVPEFVVEQWRSNDQTSMARLLMENNWSKEKTCFRVHAIKATVLCVLYLFTPVRRNRLLRSSRS